MEGTHNSASGKMWNIYFRLGITVSSRPAKGKLKWRHPLVVSRPSYPIIVLVRMACENRPTWVCSLAHVSVSWTFANKSHFCGYSDVTFYSEIGIWHVNWRLSVFCHKTVNSPRKSSEYRLKTPSPTRTSSTLQLPGVVYNHHGDRTNAKFFLF
jgi:hypothetical protein